MKASFFKPMLVFFSLCLLSTTCSEDDDDGSPNDNAMLIAQVTADVQSGTWRVTSYIDSGVDETNDFNGYDFTFSANGTLTATNGTTTKSGTWSVTDSSNSSDDSNDDNDVDFNIAFSVPESDDFDDLNDDWDLIANSSTQIQLRDVSGGDGSVDTLTFAKN
ncbi:hypothetical protein Q2T40_10510 [Winogradskyella maritima]|uniref:Lipocalin-like domain-containing protein n=1 Tax=Winogradskyella maritima TaxID=1517766 RepID=A0ABV8AME9_9FLAO|nr:hypothetical protein [Winogradskyella maritima]